MPTHFDTYTAKYGELAAHALVEMWERSWKVKHEQFMTLEDRWDFFIRETDKDLAKCAAAGRA